MPGGHVGSRLCSYQVKESMAHLWQEAMEGVCLKEMQLETSEPLAKLPWILNRAPDCMVPPPKKENTQLYCKNGTCRMIGILRAVALTGIGLEH